jgi:hypothetical protein
MVYNRGVKIMTKEQVLKRVNKKVEKLNQFVLESIASCGGEHEIYLDNSSTIISSPEFCDANYIIKEDGFLYAGETNLCRAFAEYEDEKGDFFVDFELDDFIKWEKSCIRRGVKYFKEFNPEIEENVEKFEEYYYNL